MYSTCEGVCVCVCVSVYHDAWLEACRAQQRVEMGESNQAPQGMQEDLNSSIISESQAAAMSPDCWVPVDLSLSPSPVSLSRTFSVPLFPPPPLSLSLSLLALGFIVDFSCVPGLWLLLCGRGQILTQTYVHPYTQTRASTQTHRHTNTRRG